MTSNMVPLFSLANWKNGLAFKQIHFSEKGKPVIKIAELKNGITAQTARTQQEFDSAVHLTKGDMVFSWSGNPETSIDVFWYDLPDGWLNQHIFKVTPNDGVDKLYLYYLLKYLKPRFTAIASNKQTTGLGHVTVKDMKEMLVPLPEITVQQAIGAYLYSIDQKAYINNKINDNLLRQAQLLFQSWFVDYQPFGGQMPNDWIEGVFADIVDFSNGYAFKSKELLDTPQPDCYRVFKQGHIFRGGGFNPDGTKSWYPRCKAEGLKKYVLKKGDILMAMTDMKDNVQILGNTAIMEVDDQYIVNQRVGVLRCKKECGISYPYIFLLTNSKDFLLDLRSRANSGVQVNLSSTEIKNSPVYIAPRHVYDEFTTIVLPMFEAMISNDIQNQQLAELRDTLLPKLMGGEIDVYDIEI